MAARRARSYGIHTLPPLPLPWPPRERVDQNGSFSLAHGGKDGHPFPVPLKVYDRTISVLKQAVSAARLGQTEKLDAIRRLDEQARRLEGAAAGPELEEFIESERERSHEYGGRDVSGPAQPRPQRQLALFSER